MKGNKKLLRYKDLFTTLYQEEENTRTKCYIKEIILTIDQQSVNSKLSDKYINLYCDFYDSLLTTFQNISS